MILDDYLTTKELAAELDVSAPTVVRWRLLKQGPPVTQIGRQIRYRRSSVLKWLAAQEKAFEHPANDIANYRERRPMKSIT